MTWQRVEEMRQQQTAPEPPKPVYARGSSNDRVNKPRRRRRTSKMRLTLNYRDPEHTAAAAFRRILNIGKKLGSTPLEVGTIAPKTRQKSVDSVASPVSTLTMTKIQVDGART